MDRVTLGLKAGRRRALGIPPFAANTVRTAANGNDTPKNGSAGSAIPQVRCESTILTWHHAEYQRGLSQGDRKSKGLLSQLRNSGYRCSRHNRYLPPPRLHRTMQSVDRMKPTLPGTVPGRSEQQRLAITPAQSRFLLQPSQPVPPFSSPPPSGAIWLRRETNSAGDCPRSPRHLPNCPRGRSRWTGEP